MRFPKGKKVKPGEEVSNAENDEDFSGELRNPRLAARERAKHRSEITAELLSEESRGVFHDISVVEVNYEVCFYALFIIYLFIYYDFLSFLSSMLLSLSNLTRWLQFNYLIFLFLNGRTVKMLILF